jgi:hypothetical protein
MSQRPARPPGGRVRPCPGGCYVTGPAGLRELVTARALPILDDSAGAVLPRLVGLLADASVPSDQPGLRVVVGEHGVMVGTIDDFGEAAA